MSHVDDWTVERAIIASNENGSMGTYMLQKNTAQIYVLLSIIFVKIASDPHDDF